MLLNFTFNPETKIVFFLEMPKISYVSLKLVLMLPITIYVLAGA